MTKTSETFLPRDPEKALVDIKEILYERLDMIAKCESFRDDRDEKEFLEDLLDIIERS